MSVEQREAPGAAAALGFYFNADDTPRAGSPPPTAWEPRWIEAGSAGEPLAFDPVVAPPHPGRARPVLLALLGFALLAVVATALAWSLTPRRPAPSPTAPPPAAVKAPIAKPPIAKPAVAKPAVAMPAPVPARAKAAATPRPKAVRHARSSARPRRPTAGPARRSAHHKSAHHKPAARQVARHHAAAGPRHSRSSRRGPAVACWLRRCR